MMMSTGARRLVADAPKAMARSANRRVYLTQSGPLPHSNAFRMRTHNVRGYRSSLASPYFANTAIVPLEEVVAHEQVSLWQQFVRWYSEKLNTHPLMTKSLTGAIIAAAGDVLCQAGTHYKKKDGDERSFVSQGWDIRRSFHFFVLGLTFVAPTSHYWYGGLAVHPWTKGQSFVQITKRVALDQLVWTPVFFVIWLSGFWTMEARGQISGGEVKSQLVQHLPDVMVANWLLWIPAQYLNFYACPVKFQVLFTNAVELVWNAYLSFATDGSGGHGGGGGGHQEQIEPEHKSEEFR